MLTKQTEGWPAGVSLLAVRAASSGNLRPVLASITGNQHDVHEYLVEEVIDRQPPAIRDALLKLSVVTRFSAELCNVLLDRSDGSDLLDALLRANVLLVPLDSQNEWFRFHHLLHDALTERLEREQPEVLPRLHARASAWFEENGSVAAAFSHAAASGDIARTQRLMENNGTPLYYQSRIEPVHRWLRELPESVRTTNLPLQIAYVTVLVLRGTPQKEINKPLRVAERELETARDLPGSDDLQGQLSAVRAMTAIPHGEADTAIAEAARALECLDSRNSPARLNALWSLGFGYQLQGNNKGARETYLAVLREARSTGNVVLEIGAATTLGQVEEHGGRRDEARQFFLRAIKQAGEPPLPFACEAHLGLARIAQFAEGGGSGRDGSGLSQARSHAETALDLSLMIDNVDTPASAELLLARCDLADGDGDGAQRHLDRASSVLRERGIDNKNRELAEVRVEILSRRGAHRAARDLAASHGIELPGSHTLDEPLSPREVEVLRLVAEGITNKQICDRLFIAIDTVKGHNRRIFEKLGVRRRTEAVAKARELGIL